MMIAVRQLAHDVPPLGSRRREKALGTRDAGHRHRPLPRQRDTAAVCMDGSRLAEMRHGPEDHRLAQPRGNCFGLLLRPGDDQRIRAEGGSNRLPQASRRQHLLVQIGLRHQQQIDVPPQLEMLVGVVKQVHGAAEPSLGERSGQVPIRRDDHRHAGKRTREHLRLIARSLHRLDDPLRGAHHHHAVLGATSSVAATQDGGPLSALDQQARQRCDDRRLAAAADDEVADADDRLGERPRAARNALVPGAAKLRHASVQHTDGAQVSNHFRAAEALNGPRGTDGRRPRADVCLAAAAP